MPGRLSRRHFLAASAAAIAGAPLARAAGASPTLPASATTAAAGTDAIEPGPPFRISLAQWSLHRTLRRGALDHLGFARYAREEFDIGAIEYVNTFFKDHATDADYLGEMNRRAADHGVVQHLIMCDGEGRIGDPDAAARRTAVENHFRWVDAARTLGCASIRVNAQSAGSYAEQLRLAADGLRQLCEYGDTLDIDILVENHGGLSSHGQWLAAVMRRVDHPRVGTLPDFGNFTIAEGHVYDRYQGVAELMPFARAVSAKSHDFDEHGNETGMDYRRLLRIVVDAGYDSWVGIEYEGRRLSEHAGIAATLRLLQTIREELTADV